MRGKCLAQEQYTMSPARDQARTAQSGHECTNQKDILLHTVLVHTFLYKCWSVSPPPPPPSPLEISNNPPWDLQYMYVVIFWNNTFSLFLSHLEIILIDNSYLIWVNVSSRIITSTILWRSFMMEYSMCGLTLEKNQRAFMMNIYQITSWLLIMSNSHLIFLIMVIW